MSLTLPTTNRQIRTVLSKARSLTHEGRTITFKKDTDWTDQVQQWEKDEPAKVERVRTSRVYTGKAKITTRNVESTETSLRR